MTEDEQLALALAMSAGDGSVPQQGGATPGTSGAGDDSDDDGIDEAAIWEEIRRREAAEKAAAAAGTPPPSAAAPTPAAMPAQPPPPAPAAVDPAAAAAAAAARLPAEPAAGAAGCSQVAVRLPEGRFQRRFLESDTVGVLRVRGVWGMEEGWTGACVVQGMARVGPRGDTGGQERGWRAYRFGTIAAAGVATTQAAVRTGRAGPAAQGALTPG
jgi:hypothetical protein